MKKVFLLLALVTLFPLVNFAQNVQIMPYAGYLLGGGVQFVEGKLNVNDAAVFGASIIIPDVKYSTDIEFSYFRSGSSVDFRAYPGFNLNDQSADMTSNYLQLGAISKMPVSEQVIPFFSYSVGATWFSSPDFNAVWRLSVTLGGGAKFFVTDKIGIMVRARLLVPMQFAGLGGWCGIGTGGSGCGLSANGYSVITQGDFTGGLIFKLGK